MFCLQDNTFDSYIQQSSFLSAGGIELTDAQSGMGTFGVEYSGETLYSNSIQMLQCHLFKFPLSMNYFTRNSYSILLQIMSMVI